MPTKTSPHSCGVCEHSKYGILLPMWHLQFLRFLHFCISSKLTHELKPYISYLNLWFAGNTVLQTVCSSQNNFKNKGSCLFSEKITDFWSWRFVEKCVEAVKHEEKIIKSRTLTKESISNSI